ncbi:hypothetical protein K1T71_009486, partial [Dendrolimus kikuchii]
YLDPYIVPASLEQLLVSSDVVGNIRFSHPTLYVFPGGQGDAALFGINGFNMLVDGGFSRKACWWDFARHLDRLDAVLFTRLNNCSSSGMASVLRRKATANVYPQIGHFFCNLEERRSLASPDGDKDADPLLVSLLQQGSDMMADLRHINLKPQHCYRNPEPINLYHKVGHGTLDMYVLNPSKDSKYVREFLKKWHSSEQRLFEGASVSGQFNFPIPNLVSICALLVWRPANPDDTITRIMFPGSTPQHKIFEGLEKLKHLEFLQHPTCTGRQMAPVPPPVTTTTTTVTSTKTARATTKISKEKIVSEKTRDEKIIESEPPPKDKDVRDLKYESDSKNIIDNKLINELVDGEEKKLESVLQDAITARIETKLDDKVAQYESTVLDGLSKKKDVKKKATDKKKKIDKTDEIKDSVVKSDEVKKAEKKKVESKPKTEITSTMFRTKISHKATKAVEKKITQNLVEKKITEDKKSPPTTPKKTLDTRVGPPLVVKDKIKIKSRRLSPSTTTAKSVKEATNRRVVESKYKQSSPKRDVTKTIEKKETKTKREPLSRRPRPLASPVKGLKTMKSPSKSAKASKADTSKLKGLQRVNYEDILKDAKKSDEDTSKSLDDIKQQELDEREEQEIVREIEAVFNRDSEAEEKIEFVGRSDIEKITCMIDEAKTETTADGEFEEEYLIIEKEEIEQYPQEAVIEHVKQDDREHEEELLKHLRDTEESEKIKDVRLVTQENEKDIQIVKLDDSKLKMEATTEVETKQIESKEHSVSVEEKQDISSEKKTSDSKSAQKIKYSPELIQHQQESQPDEKISTTIESGATTAPTLPEDERITLDDIVEDQHIEPKVSKEESKEVLFPQNLIDIRKPTLLQKTSKLDNIPLPVREIVKTPDEVADLPLHEEVDYRAYEDKKTPEDDLFKSKHELGYVQEIKAPKDLPLSDDVIVKTVQRASHAEIVTVTPGSAPESPMYHEQFKVSVLPGKDLHSVKEYDETYNYEQYTEKLRETHITTLDSPIKDDIIIVEDISHMPEKIPSIPEDVEKEIEEAQYIEGSEKPPISPIDVEKIVADVAEVLKSEKSLDEIMAEKSPVSASKSPEALYKTDIAIISNIEATKLLLESEKQTKTDNYDEIQKVLHKPHIKETIDMMYVQKEISPVRSITSEDVSEFSDKTVISEGKRVKRELREEKPIFASSNFETDFENDIVSEQKISIPVNEKDRAICDLQETKAEKVLSVCEEEIKTTKRVKSLEKEWELKEKRIAESNGHAQDILTQEKITASLQSAKTLEKLEEKIVSLKKKEDELSQKMDHVEKAFKETTAFEKKGPRLFEKITIKPTLETTLDTTHDKKDVNELFPAKKPSPVKEALKEPVPIKEDITEPIVVDKEIKLDGKEPSLVKEALKEPSPVREDVKEPILVDKEIELDEKEPSPVKEALKEPSPIKKDVKEPIVVDKEINLDEKEPSPVKEALKEPSPVREDVKEPILVDKEIKLDEKEPSSDKEALKEPSPVKEDIKEPIVVNKEIKLDEREPSPVKEALKEPSPVREDIKEPILLDKEIKLDEKEPSPVKEALKEPVPIKEDITEPIVVDKEIKLDEKEPSLVKEALKEPSPVREDVKEPILVDKEIELDEKEPSPVKEALKEPSPIKKDVKEPIVVDKEIKLDEKEPSPVKEALTEPSPVKEDIKEPIVVDKEYILDEKEPSPVKEALKEPSPVREDIKEPIVVDKEIKLDEKKPSLDKEALKEPSPVRDYIKEPTVVDKEILLDEKEPSPVKEALKEPSPVKQDIKEPILLDKEIKPDKKEPSPVKEVLKEPSPVKEDIKEPIVVDKEIKLDEKEPSPVKEALKKPSPVRDDIKEPILLGKEIELDEKEPSPDKEALKEPGTVKEIVKEPIVVDKEIKLDEKAPSLVKEALKETSPVKEDVKEPIVVDKEIKLDEKEPSPVKEALKEPVPIKEDITEPIVVDKEIKLDEKEPILVKEALKEPSPVREDVKEPILVDKEIELDEKEPSPVKEALKEPSPIKKDVKEPIVVDKEIKLDEKEPSPVKEALKEPSPVREDVKEPILVDKEIKLDEKEPSSDKEALKEPSPVKEDIKEPIVVDKEIKLDEREPSPVKEALKEPSPVREDIKEPILLDKEIKLDEKEPSPVKEALKEPVPIKEDITEPIVVDKEIKLDEKEPSLVKEALKEPSPVREDVKEPILVDKEIELDEKEPSPDKEALKEPSPVKEVVKEPIVVDKEIKLDEKEPSPVKEALKEPSPVREAIKEPIVFDKEIKLDEKEPSPVKEALKEPSPVREDVKEPILVDKEIKLDEKEPSPEKEALKEPSPVKEIVKERIVVDKEIKLDEKEPSPVKEALKEPSPVREDIKEPILVDKEIKLDEKEPSPDKEALKESSSVKEVVKEPIVVDKEIKLDEKAPSPDKEALKEPSPIKEDVKEPILVDKEIKLDEKEPSPIKEALKEPSPVSEDIKETTVIDKEIKLDEKESSPVKEAMKEPSPVKEDIKEPIVVDKEIKLDGKEPSLVKEALKEPSPVREDVKEPILVDKEIKLDENESSPVKEALKEPSTVKEIVKEPIVVDKEIKLDEKAPSPVKEALKEPSPVREDVKEPILVDKEIELDEKEPSPVKEALKEPSPVKEDIKEPIVVDKEIKLDEKEPSPVKEALKEPSPVREDIKEPILLDKEIELDEKEPSPVKEAMKKPSPVKEDVTEPIVVDKEIKLDEKEPSPVKEALKEPSPVREDIKEPIVVDKEINLDEKEPSPVKEALKEPSPVREDVKEPILVDKEIKLDEKEPSSDKEALKEPSPVKEDIKEPIVVDKEIKLDEKEPSPVKEALKEPSPVREDVKEPILVDKEIKLDEKEPSSDKEALKEPSPVKEDIKEPFVVDKEIKLDEREPSPVKEALKEPSPVRGAIKEPIVVDKDIKRDVKEPSPVKEVVKEPIVVDKEIKIDKKEPSPVKEALEEPSPVKEDVKEPIVVDKEIKLDEKEPSPVIEVLKEPSPVKEDIKEPIVVDKEIKLDEKEPSPVKEDIKEPIVVDKEIKLDEKEPSPVKEALKEPSPVREAIKEPIVFDKEIKLDEKEPSPVKEALKEPSPVREDVKEPILVDKEIKLDEKEPSPEKEALKEPSPVKEIVKERIVVDKEYVLNEKEPSPVKEALKEPSPVREDIKETILVDKVIKLDEKEPSPDKEALKESSSVKEVVKEPIVVDKEIKLDEKAPSPDKEALKEPSPIKEDVKEPILVDNEIKLDEKEPSPIKEALKEPSPVSEDIKETTVIDKEIKLDEEESSPVKEAMKEPSPVKEDIKEPIVVDKEIKLDEKEPSLVKEALKEPSPVREDVKEPILVDKEIKLDEKEPSPEKEALKEPSPVKEIVKERIVVDKEYVLNEKEPSPVKEALKEPSPVREDIKETILVDKVIKLDEKEPSPDKEALKESSSVKEVVKEPIVVDKEIKLDEKAPSPDKEALKEPSPIKEDVKEPILVDNEIKLDEKEPSPIKEALKEPSPVSEDIKETTVIDKEIKLDEEESSPVKEAMKEPSPVKEDIKEPIVVDKEIKLDEKEPSLVKEALKEPSPVREDVKETILVDKEIKLDEKEPSPDKEALKEPSSVKEVVKEPTVVDKEIKLDEKAPRPDKEALKEPSPIKEDVKEPILVDSEIKLDEKEPSPIKEALKEPSPVKEDIKEPIVVYKEIKLDEKEPSPVKEALKEPSPVRDVIKEPILLGKEIELDEKEPSPDKEALKEPSPVKEVVKEPIVVDKEIKLDEKEPSPVKEALKEPSPVREAIKEPIVVDKEIKLDEKEPSPVKEALKEPSPVREDVKEPILVNKEIELDEKEPSPDKEALKEPSPVKEDIKEPIVVDKEIKLDEKEPSPVKEALKEPSPVREDVKEPILVDKEIKLDEKEPSSDKEALKEPSPVKEDIKEPFVVDKEIKLDEREPSPLEELKELTPVGEPEQTETTETQEIQEKGIIIMRTIVTNIIKTKYCDKQGKLCKVKTVTTVTTTDQLPDGSTRTTTETCISITEIELSISEIPELKKLQKIAALSEKAPSPEKESTDTVAKEEKSSIETKETSPETLRIQDALKDLTPLGEPEITETTDTKDIEEKEIIIKRVIVIREVRTKYADKQGILRKLKTVTTVTTTDNYPDSTTRTSVQSSTTVTDIQEDKDTDDETFEGFEPTGETSEDKKVETETITEGGILIKRKVTTTTIVKIFTNVVDGIRRTKTTVKTVTEDEHPDGAVITKTSEKVSTVDETIKPLEYAPSPIELKIKFEDNVLCQPIQDTKAHMEAPKLDEKVPTSGKEISELYDKEPIIVKEVKTDGKVPSPDKDTIESDEEAPILIKRQIKELNLVKDETKPDVKVVSPVHKSAELTKQKILDDDQIKQEVKFDQIVPSSLVEDIKLGEKVISPLKDLTEPDKEMSRRRKREAKESSPDKEEIQAHEKSPSLTQDDEKPEDKILLVTKDEEKLVIQSSLDKELSPLKKEIKSVEGASSLITDVTKPEDTIAILIKEEVEVPSPAMEETKPDTRQAKGDIKPDENKNDLIDDEKGFSTIKEDFEDTCVTTTKDDIKRDAKIHTIEGTPSDFQFKTDAFLSKVPEIEPSSEKKAQFKLDPMDKKLVSLINIKPQDLHLGTTHLAKRESIRTDDISEITDMPSPELVQDFKEPSSITTTESKLFKDDISDKLVIKQVGLEKDVRQKTDVIDLTDIDGGELKKPDDSSVLDELDAVHKASGSYSNGKLKLEKLADDLTSPKQIKHSSLHSIEQDEEVDLLKHKSKEHYSDSFDVKLFDSDITKKELKTSYDEKDIDEKENKILDISSEQEEKSNENDFTDSELNKITQKCQVLDETVQNVKKDFQKDVESASEDSEVKLEEVLKTKARLTQISAGDEISQEKKQFISEFEPILKDSASLPYDVKRRHNIQDSLDKCSISTIDSGVTDKDSITQTIVHGSSSEDLSKEISLEEKYSYEISEKYEFKDTSTTEIDDVKHKHYTKTETTSKVTDSLKEEMTSETTDSGVHSILDTDHTSNIGEFVKDSAVQLMESIHKAFEDDTVQQGIKTDDFESLVVHPNVDRVSTPPTVPVSPLPKTPSSIQDVKMSEGMQSEITYDKSDSSEEIITKVVHVGEDVLTQKISTSTEKLPRLPKASELDGDPELLSLMQTVGKIKTETDTVTKIIKEGENVVTQTITTVTTKEIISREDGTPQNIKTTIETTTLSKGPDGSITTTKDTQTLLSECSSSLRSTSQLDYYTKDSRVDNYDVEDKSDILSTFQIKDLSDKQAPSLIRRDMDAFISVTDESDDNVEDTTIDTDVSKKIIKENNIDIVETTTTTTKKETIRASESKKILRTTTETNITKELPDGTRDVQKNVEVKTEELVLGSSENVDKILSKYFVYGEPEESVITKTEDIKQETLIIKRTIITRIIKTKYADSQSIPRKLKTVSIVTIIDDYPDNSSQKRVESNIVLTDIDFDMVENLEMQSFNVVENKSVETETQEKNIDINGKSVLQIVTTTTTKEILTNERKSERKLRTTIETVTETLLPNGTTEVTKDIKVSVSDYLKDVIEDIPKGFKIEGDTEEDIKVESLSLTENAVLIKRKITIITTKQKFVNVEENIQRTKTSVVTLIEDEYPDSSVITKTSEKVSYIDNILDSPLDTSYFPKDTTENLDDELKPFGEPEVTESIEIKQYKEKDVYKGVDKDEKEPTATEEIKLESAQIDKLPQTAVVIQTDQIPQSVKEKPTPSVIQNQLVDNEPVDSMSSVLEKELIQDDFTHVEALKNLLPIEEPEITETTDTKDIEENKIVIKRVIIIREARTKYADIQGIPRKLKTVTTLTTTDNYPDGTTRTSVQSSTTVTDIQEDKDSGDEIFEGFEPTGETSEDKKVETETITEGGILIKRKVTTTTIVQIFTNVVDGIKRTKTTVKTVIEDEHPDGTIVTKTGEKVSMVDETLETLSDYVGDSYELEELKELMPVGEPEQTETTETQEIQEKGIIIMRTIVTNIIKTKYCDKQGKLCKVKTVTTVTTTDQLPDGSTRTTTETSISITEIELSMSEISEMKKLQKIAALSEKAPSPEKESTVTVTKEEKSSIETKETSPETLRIQDALKDLTPLGEPEITETTDTKDIEEKEIIIKRVIVIREVRTKYADKQGILRKLKTVTTVTTTDTYPDSTTRTSVQSSTTVTDIQEDKDTGDETFEGFEPTGETSEDKKVETETITEGGILIKRKITTTTIVQAYNNTRDSIRRIKTTVRIVTEDEHPDGAIVTTTSEKVSMVDECLQSLLEDGVDYEDATEVESSKIESCLKDLFPVGEPEESEDLRKETFKENESVIQRTIVDKIVRTKYANDEGVLRKMKTVKIVTNTDQYPDGSIKTTVNTSTSVSDIEEEESVHTQDLKEYSHLENKSVSVDIQEKNTTRDGKEVKQIITTTITKEMLSTDDGSKKKLRTTTEAVTETKLPTGITEVTKDIKVSVADYGIESLDENLVGFSEVGIPDEHTTHDIESLEENGISIVRKTTVTTIRQEYENVAIKSKKVKTVVKTIVEDEYPDGTVITKKSEKVSIADVILKIAAPGEIFAEPPESYIDDTEVVEDTTEDSDIKNEIIQQGPIKIKRTITTKTRRDTLASSDKNIKRVRTTVETITVDLYPDGSTETTKDVKITVSEFQKTSDSTLQAALQGLVTTGKIKTSVDKKTNIIIEQDQKITQTITKYVTKEELKNSKTNEIAVKTVTETITENAIADGSVETTKDVRTQITYLPLGTGLDDWSPEELEEIEKQPIAKEEMPVAEKLQLPLQETPTTQSKTQQSPVGKVTTDTETFTKVLKEGETEITQTITVVTTKEVISPEKIKITVETTTVSKGSDGVTKTTKSTKTTISEFREEYEESIDKGESEKSFSKLSTKTSDMQILSASDDFEHLGISSPPSEISSKAATHLWGTDSSGMYYSDDDGQGSPSSTKSQIAHSPRSNLSFELDTKLPTQRESSQEILFDKHDLTSLLAKDPMTTSTYGQLTDIDSGSSSSQSEAKTEIQVVSKSVNQITEDFIAHEKSSHSIKSDATFLKEADEHFEKAIEEHKKVSGSDVISNITAKYELDKKISSTHESSSKEESTITLKDLKTESKKITESSSSMSKSVRETSEPRTERRSVEKDGVDPIESWGKPLGLPSPILPPMDGKSTPKKQNPTVTNKNKINQEKSKEAKRASESPSKKKGPSPVYMELTYVPHHGNSYYSAVEFFKRVRARYYVFSGTEPSKEIYNALLDAKKTWEDKDLEVTIIPTYDTDVLGFWVTENEEALEKYKIDLSPSASRCTINLQDHETSCAAYRLEF